MAEKADTTVVNQIDLLKSDLTSKSSSKSDLTSKSENEVVKKMEDLSLGDLEGKIIELLREHPDGLNAKEIVIALDLKEKKEVNPTLYKMASKKILRYSQPGPLWKLLEIKKRSEDDEKILRFLAEKKEPVPTLVIAKQIFGDTAVAKMINPLLYSLAKQGKIVKTSESNGTKPRWSLK